MAPFAPSSDAAAAVAESRRPPRVGRTVSSLVLQICAALLLLALSTSSFHIAAADTPSLSPRFGSGWSAGDAGLLLNVSGIMPPGASFQSIPLLDAGWSLASLCASLPSRPSTCSMHFSLTQKSPLPSPASGSCALVSVVQVDCKAQTDDPQNYAQMVCISLATPGKTHTAVFPQDSPTVASMQTAFTGLSSSLAVDAGDLVVNNPATASLSPSRLGAMERVARRNQQLGKVASTAAPAPTGFRRSIPADEVHLDTPALPVRVQVLNARASSCGAPISYDLVVRLEANEGCASYAWAPGTGEILPGSNATDAGWNVTTPVPCNSPHGSCLVTPTDELDPHNGNVTARCLCDSGWGSLAPNASDADASEGDCFADLGADISVPLASARPPPYGNTTHPAMNWLEPNSSPIKGSIGGAMGLFLNASSSSSSSLGAPALSEYWYARVNTSRALQDLSLTIHVTVLSVGPDGSGRPSQAMPVRLSFSPDFYPSIHTNTPLGCPNGTDLGPASKVQGGTAAAAAAGSDGEAQLEKEEKPSVWSWSSNVGSPSSSCVSLYAQFPDTVTTLGSPNAFKLVLHPAFIAGFLNRTASSGNSSHAADGEVPLYFSLFFQQPLLVDVRVWWQQNLEIYTPRMLGPLETSSGAGAAASYGSGVVGDVKPVTLPRPPAVTTLTLAADDAAPQNQTWVHELLENELVYFHINTPPRPRPREGVLLGDGGVGAGGVGADPRFEQASLYVVINDTACVSGAAVQGYYAPHWWLGAMAPGDAAAAGVAQTPLAPSARPPVAGHPSHMALGGGCLRPFERLQPTPAASAGLFGQLYSICAAGVELTLWHVAPQSLDTKGMDSAGVWTSSRLNATGAGCWREMSFTISTSVPNDMLITVDQSDAVVLLALQPAPGPGDQPAPAVYPTRGAEYNATSQVAVDPSDGAGSSTKWQQRRIAYTDLSHSQTWIVSVYFDPAPNDGGAPHQPRNFRVRMSWATDGGSFAHMSRTLVVIFSVGGSIAGLLLMVALKMRIDACRRERAAKGKADARLEKIRLMQQGRQHQDYMRL